MVTLGIETRYSELVELPELSRLHGLYVLGRNGMGKSSLFAAMIAEDMLAGRGLALLDPHGDLTTTILSHIPQDRQRDVIFFDAGDPNYLVGLNLFDCPVDDELARVRTAENVVQVFKRIWGMGEDASWGPRLEDLLRNTAFAFIDNPGATLIDLPRFLTETTFRQQLVNKIQNPVVKSFWEHEYPKDNRTQSEWRSPVLNKVRAFLVNPLIARIVSSPQTTLDLRKVMDSGKILLVKLALGKIDEQSVTLLGSLLVGQLLLAAQTRQDMPQGSRQPFYLFCDEYQRFQTPSFATLIDEARKYGVATAIAHQWRGQLVGSFRNAPLGAVNTVVFQVIAPDADELAPIFDTAPPPRQIIGERPDKMISRTASRALSSGSHPNDRINAIWRTLGNGGLLLGQWFHHAAQEAVDDYLYARMQGKAGKEAYERVLHFYRADLKDGLYWELKPPGTSIPVSAFIFEQAYWHQDEDEQFALLRQLGDLLEQDPIIVNSSRTTPIYDAARTHADMRAEIANNLARLPQLQAHYRLLAEREIHEGILQVKHVGLRQPFLPPPRRLPETARLRTIPRKTQEETAPKVPVIHKLSRREPV